MCLDIRVEVVVAVVNSNIVEAKAAVQAVARVLPNATLEDAITEE
jgi:hypothetical protein